MNELPNDIVDLLAEHHADSADCVDCDSSCCFESGFAIKQNVANIYEAYQQGRLDREDYAFTRDLPYDHFVSTYFDVLTSLDASPDLYFPLHLTREKLLLRVPFNPNWPDYWGYRSSILKNPVNQACGCVFLRHGFRHSANNKCILHEQTSMTTLGGKPIDCIFLACNPGRRVRQPSDELEKRWFELLRKHYGKPCVPSDG